MAVGALALALEEPEPEQVHADIKPLHEAPRIVETVDPDQADMLADLMNKIESDEQYKHLRLSGAGIMEVNSDGNVEFHDSKYYGAPVRDTKTGYAREEVKTETVSEPAKPNSFEDIARDVQLMVAEMYPARSEDVSVLVNAPREVMTVAMISQGYDRPFQPEHPLKTQDAVMPGTGGVLMGAAGLAILYQGAKKALGKVAEYLNFA